VFGLVVVVVLLLLLLVVMLLLLLVLLVVLLLLLLLVVLLYVLELRAITVHHLSPLAAFAISKHIFIGVLIVVCSAPPDTADRTSFYFY
jgi:hypothetical protein